jgi:hypothetical protein
VPGEEIRPVHRPLNGNVPVPPFMSGGIEKDARDDKHKHGLLLKFMRAVLIKKAKGDSRRKAKVPQDQEVPSAGPERQERVDQTSQGLLGEFPKKRIYLLHERDVAAIKKEKSHPPCEFGALDALSMNDNG